MKSSKKALSVGRYFRARLKPFGRFAFWGPLSFLAVASLLVWQYSQNPQWRDSTAEQPDGLENSSDRDIGAEMPLQSLEQDAQRQQRESGVDFQNATNGQTPLNNSSEKTDRTSNPTGSTLEQLTRTQKNNQQKDEKAESSSIFLPLMPGVDTNALPLTSSNTTSKNKPKNSAQSSDRSALINGLIKPKPVTVTENSLQDAMSQQFRSNTNTDSSTTATQNNITGTTGTTSTTSTTTNNLQTNRGVESVTSPQVTGPTNSLPGQTTVPQPYSQSYPSPYKSVPSEIGSAQPSTLGQQQSTIPTYQYPYVNSPVQTNSVQQPVQSQTPYINSPVTTNPTGVGNPVGTNQTQTNTQSYPSPYLNSPVQTTSPVTPTQNVQPNYNNNVVNYPRSQGTDERFRVGY
jgi:hypothetical protein